MKTNDEILLFLVRNSVPDYFHPLSEDEFSYGTSDGKTHHLTKKEKLKLLLLRLAGTNRYTCELSKFEEFLGEKFNFEKHLRPLFEEGTLFFSIPEKGSFYDSTRYREISAHVNGIIGNSKNKWVAFWYRENNFLNDIKNILENVRKFKLF
jgi:hypothetical protein